MPDCPWSRVQRVAHVAHEVLDELGATGWPKTSGGRGLHVYVRIPPDHGFADVRRAALAFAREIEAGVVHVNSETAGAEPQVPFGGMKGSSSYSREQGKAAREFFTQMKTVYIDPPPPA